MMYVLFSKILLAIKAVAFIIYRRSEMSSEVGPDRGVCWSLECPLGTEP